LGFFDSKDSLLYLLTDRLKYPRATRLAVSKDLNYLFNEGEIYDIKKNRYLGGLFKNKRYYYRVRGAKFLNDNKHVAVLHSSGDVIIYEINPSDRRHPVKLSKIINSEKDEEGKRASAFTIDSKDSLLIMADWRGNVSIREIGQLNKSTTINSREQLYKMILEPSGQLGTTPLKNYGSHIDLLTISPNDSLLLGASRDGKVMIWDMNTKDVIFNDSGISGMKIYKIGFMDNDRFYTVERSSRICVWVYNNVKNSNDIFRFSPFYFKNVNLRKELWERFYQSNSIEDKYLNFSNYLMSFPRLNTYQGNLNYRNLLKDASKEVESEYKDLLNHKDYKNIKPYSRFLLGKKFLNFKYSVVPNLLSIERSKNKESLFTESINYVKETNTLLEDNFDMQLTEVNLYRLIRIINSSNLNLIVTQSKITSSKPSLTKKGTPPIPQKKDSLNTVLNEKIDWEKSEMFFKEYERIIHLFNKQNEIDSITYSARTMSYMATLSLNAYSNSFQALLEKKYGMAIQMSRLPLLWDEKNWQTVEKNLALAYLLNDQWDKAEPIYRKWNNKFFDSETEMLADDVFKEDILKLRKSGIVHENFNKVLDILKD